MTVTLKVPDGSVAKAAERLEKIYDEIAVLQAEAREIEGALSVMRRFGASVPNFDPGSKESPKVSTVPVSVSDGALMPQAEFIPLARQLIEEANRPLTRTQLLRRFAEIGRPITGTDAIKN